MLFIPLLTAVASSSASTEEPSDADLLAAAAYIGVMGESVIFMNRFTFYFQDTIVHCLTCFVILYYQLSDDVFGNGKVGGVLHLLIMPAHTLSFLLLLLLLLFYYSFFFFVAF